jgi:ketopantoate reductase
MNKILIVGAGSIGTLIGASLIRAGLEVTFAGRPKSDYTEHIKHYGLTVSYASGEHFWISPFLPGVRFVDTEEKLEEVFKIIIVAVKSNHLAAVTSYIRSHSTQETILFHAQNGIPYWWFAGDNYLSSLNQNIWHQIVSRPYLDSVDPEGKILKSLGDRTLVGCVVKAPCCKTKLGEGLTLHFIGRACTPHQIEVKKSPKMIVGFIGSNQNNSQRRIVWDLCQILSTYGLETSYTTQIRVEVCNKLAINITTNVLSALTGHVISELTSNSYINSLIANILSEIKIIFQTYGIKKDNLPTENKVYNYITEPGSQQHLPSLAQDFSRHQEGEISLITAPVEMARIAKIKVPTLFSLGKLLQLGQNYALNSGKDTFNILNFNKSSGYCLLTNDVWQSNICSQIEISELLTHLVQINLATLEQSVA